MKSSDLSIKAKSQINRERIRRNVANWRLWNPELNAERQSGYSKHYYLSLIPDEKLAELDAWEARKATKRSEQAKRTTITRLEN
jgi:hypothetical protein